MSRERTGGEGGRRKREGERRGKTQEGQAPDAVMSAESAWNAAHWHRPGTLVSDQRVDSLVADNLALSYSLLLALSFLGVPHQ